MATEVRDVSEIRALLDAAQSEYEEEDRRARDTAARLENMSGPPESGDPVEFHLRAAEIAKARGEWASSQGLARETRQRRDDLKRELSVQVSAEERVPIARQAEKVLKVGQQLERENQKLCEMIDKAYQRGAAFGDQLGPCDSKPMLAFKPAHGKESRFTAWTNYMRNEGWLP